MPFYGRQAAVEDVPKIEAVLKEHGKDYTAHIYPDVNHGFHNDTTPRYDEAAAQLARERTVDFFNTHLL